MTDDFKFTEEEKMVANKKILYPRGPFSREELEILSNLKKRFDKYYGNQYQIQCR